MYLQKPHKNKYSIGKALRASKNLRKKDNQAKIIQMPPQLKQYTQQLQKKGMQVKNLDYALFYTKNGLPYPGLIAKQNILANTIMLRVPLQCLLTTRIAFFSQIQKVFQQNPKYFSKHFTTDWEDHILLAFILFQLQKGTNSKWYNLIRNLPRDIDYAIFWKKQQLQVMQDDWMQLGILQQKALFQKQCDQFIKICQKYPQYFQKNTYSIQNIKWIQSHLVTRCFGKYFEYTTMVPFAQLFNHECVDVYYSMDYKPGNPHTQNQQFYPQKDLSPEQQQQIQSSDGSYDAEDFYEDNQYFQATALPEQQEPSYNKNWNESKQKKIYFQNSNISIDKDLKSIKSYMLTFISFNDAVSLNFLQQIFLQLQKIADKQISTQQQYQFYKQKLKQIHSINVKYVKAVKNYYSEVKSKHYVYGLRQKKKKQQKNKEEEEPKQGEQYFDKVWPEDKFDDFVMLCSTKDQFQKGSQVYFCYGRLPNKLLLLRYGIALEGNKYNHLFIRINISDRVQKVKSLKYIVQNQVNMRKFKRFKLKRTKFCIQLITYLRAEEWKYPQNVDNIFVVRNIEKQLKILENAKQFYINELNKYKQSLEKNKQKLSDKCLNYHEYFCLIYKIQNQEILSCQIGLIQYAKQILIKYLNNGNSKSIKQILLEQTQKQKLTMQLMLQNYFKTIEPAKI